MRTVDFSPLFRSAIGFDRLFELAEAAQRVGEESYPPTTSSAPSVSAALAGFSPDEAALTVEQNVLTLEGRKSDKAGAERFYVVLSAGFQDGLLGLVEVGINTNPDTVDPRISLTEALGNVERPCRMDGCAHAPANSGPAAANSKVLF